MGARAADVSRRARDAVRRLPRQIVQGAGEVGEAFDRLIQFDPDIIRSRRLAAVYRFPKNDAVLEFDPHQGAWRHLASHLDGDSPRRSVGHLGSTPDLPAIQHRDHYRLVHGKSRFASAFHESAYRPKRPKTL